MFSSMDWNPAVNDRGQSVVQMLLAIMLTAIIVIGLASMGTIIAHQQHQANFTFQVSQVRTSLVNLINNPNSWTQTYRSPLNSLGNGSGLDCLYYLKPCTADEFGDLGTNPVGVPIGSVTPAPVNAILDASGNVYYDSTNPTSGFTATGATCTGFVPPPAAGNDACPLRFNITWQALCSTTPAPGTCVNAKPEITIQVVFNPATPQYVFNPRNYAVVPFVQGSAAGAVGHCWNKSGATLDETCADTVGIGTSTPAVSLDVKGQLRASFVSGTSLTIDWTKGNIQSTSAIAGPLTFLLNSMFDGATYSLILTSTGIFTLPTTGDVATWRCVPSCTGNQINASGGQTIVSIVKAGTTGYVSWAGGF